MTVLAVVYKYASSRGQASQQRHFMVTCIGGVELGMEDI